ncbi:MAG TPA: dienelactone hydrolase family protein [Sphingomicrobium sp.]|nr:dienelactone hydrolase family protein [Sphingomicrobium sp.]
MDDGKRQQAILLYDRFTHEERPNPDCSGGAIDRPLERRRFMAEMTRIAGSAAAATALIGSISASPAAAAIVAETDRRLRTSTVRLLGGSYSAYVAEPRAAAARRSTVLVIHENRGLNAHIKDIARRLALAGHYAVAPDFLSPSGGTPANEDAARDAIGKLDLGAATAAGIAMLDSLEDRRGGNGKVGAVGFCWGGAFVNRLAIGAGSKLDAGVVFYGTAPAPAEAARVNAPLMVHLAGLDQRVNQTAFPWITALRSAGRKVAYHNYDGVNHAFNNDTSAERYDKAAADLAWKRTLAFFRRHLA